MSLSGGTLHWTSDLGGASSVTLGPDVVPPASPRALTVCQLLSAADLTPVLGQMSGSGRAGPGSCTYTSASHAGMSLTLGLQTVQREQ